MYYYDFGMNYPFMGAVNLPQNTTIAQVPQINTQTQPINTQNTEKAQTEQKSSSNEKLLWLGLTGLAVLGTYLLTKGHYKGKIPSTSATSQASASTSQAVAEGAGQIAKPIPENVANFVNGYKPFAGIEGVSGEIKPVIQRVGSRCRADFIHTINGQNIRETLIFNAEGKPVSRFVETTSQDGKEIVRKAYKINDKGELLPDVVQTSTRRKFYNTDRNTGERTSSRFGIRKTIENHDIGFRNDLPLENDDAMRRIRYNELQFMHLYDEKSGKLLYKNVSRDLINSQDDIVNWSDHTCFYGYDKDGKLAGIISEKRLPDLSKICEYIPVENGVFGTPTKLDARGRAPYLNGQEGSPKEAEYFELWRQSSKPV
ncbi:hypothetical protein J6P92_00640 [bacterium]|nr:hypothetical protein [bacterium]